MTEYPREIEAIQFSLLSPEEIRKNGVIEIVSSDLNFLGRDGEGGLNDPHLGVINKGDRCKTCYLDSEKCPGHFGFINLAYPLYKQEYTKNIKLILELTCIHCNQLLFKREKLKMETNGLHLNDAYTRLKAMLPAGTAIKICPHCNTVQPKIKTNTMLSIEYTYSHIRNADYTKNNINAVLPNGLDERVLTEFIVYPHNDVYKRLCTLSNDTIGILRMNARYARPEWMMWTVLPVAPPVVRPNTQNDGQHSYDDWTHCYMDIINTNNKLKNLAESGKETTELINALNISVAASIFNSINPLVHKQTRKPLTGAKARLDGNSPTSSPKWPVYPPWCKLYYVKWQHKKLENWQSPRHCC
jgi:DNA-directed RNA polymerase beta' subunit